MPRKPNLSPEQQEWLNRVFIPNFKRELIKNLKPADFKSSKMTGKENKSANVNVLAGKEKELDKALKEAAKEREHLTGIIAEMKIDRELVASASRQNSVNPSQVAQLLKNSVWLNDEMTPVVLDNDGEPAINGEGKLMTIDELVGKFLEGNPHFVKANSGTSGSGAIGFLADNNEKSEMTSGDLIAAGLREERTRVRR